MIDGWQKLLEGEREELRFFLQEEFKGAFEMTLQEILESLQTRIDFMAKMDDAAFSEWLGVYQAIAQVKQAIALEHIAKRLDGWNVSGVPVENVH